MPNMKYWVGLQRSGNDWQWVDSSTSVYRNWANNVTPTRGCVVANAPGTVAGSWSGMACNQRYQITVAATVFNVYLFATTQSTTVI
ncbi:unnamed protein product [Enterobius vermicularis]|uniref:C-type lectin domain-containing protein n=1 Tax=Enterobius vermicularis TaxID=51028 RepID=A0A0N4V0Y1_ENTVE|nr:unnamed protein product [Enterobius vermicularis]